jgi:hypothetical protein
MTIVFVTTLAVACAAICVWLAVRIVNRKERWAKWSLAAVVGAPVLYIASLGPACWLFANNRLSYRQFDYAYGPLVDLAVDGPNIVQGPLRSWVTLCHGGDGLLIAQILRGFS